MINLNKVFIREAFKDVGNVLKAFIAINFIVCFIIKTIDLFKLNVKALLVSQALVIVVF